MDRVNSIVLHCCCAPCSCAVIEMLVRHNIGVTLLFYNPNIFPEEEYLRRKESIMALADFFQVLCIDQDYDYGAWCQSIKGYEQEPEGGARCGLCFQHRLQYTAQFAHDHGYVFFSTTLTMSRHKDVERIHALGHAIARHIPAIEYWDFPWRKYGSIEMMHKLSKSLGLYRQTYCGCEFSLRPKVNT